MSATLISRCDLIIPLPCLFLCAESYPSYKTFVQLLLIVFSFKLRSSAISALVIRGLSTSNIRTIYSVFSLHFS